MPANYVLLERVTLTSTTASIVLDNIPQTGYTDLKLVVSARGDAGSLPDVMLRFNGDTGSNYIARELTGNGASAGTGGYTTSDAHVQTNGNTTTAATFSNAEIYIPNYRVAGVQKSFLGDAVNENNTASTLVQSRLIMWRWTGTAAINTINILTNGGNYVANTTFSLYGIAALGTEPVILPKATGGDIVQTDGTYWYHTFLASSVFTPSQALTNVDFLVVAGGGAGGFNWGGGGGAGGFRTSAGTSGGGGSAESKLSLIAQAYPVTVGAGGSGQTNLGTAGSSSVFSSITSLGGGVGGGDGGNTNVYCAGGSGGGLQRSNAFDGGNGTANQGYRGGKGDTPSGNLNSGGGGGAGSVGQDGKTSQTSGNGGSGVTSSISGSSVMYAGGGGGGGLSSQSRPAGTGTDGGGNGAYTNDTNGTAGAISTGSGGGAGAGGSPGGRGGAGGSGIVIVRYTVA